MLVFAVAVGVGGGAGVAFEEEELDDAFVGVDAAVGVGGVADFEGEVSFPSGFGGGEVGDAADAGVGAFADAEDADVGGHFERFEGDAESVGMRGEDEVVSVFVAVQGFLFEVVGIEGFGVDDGAGDVTEDAEIFGG